MRRDGMLLGGGALFALLVLAYGVFAWISTEREVLDAAAAEGRALLRAVAAGIESNLDASRAVEELLSDRLLELATQLEREIAAQPGREAEVLAAFVAAHDLRGGVLLDSGLGVVAFAGAARRTAHDGGPFSAGRLGRLEAESLARRAREAGLAETDRIVFGFAENPFGSRTEYLVGARAPRAGGYLILRRDASQLMAFEEAAGVRRLLRQAVEAPAIDDLVLHDADGRVLAAGDPAREGTVLPPPSAQPAWRTRDDGTRVLDLALAAPWKGPPEGYLRVGVNAEPVQRLLDRSRRNVLIFTALVLLAGGGGLAFLGVRERRARAREEALRRELEERERFASLGRMAGGVAHEIRSPLNALSIAAQRLRREAVPEDEARRRRFDDLVSSLGASIERVDRTVEEFLSLGSRRPLDPARCDVASLLRDVVAEEGARAELEGPDVALQADRELLARAFANLIRNAGSAAPDGTVRVRWEAVDGELRVDVIDSGPGIPAEERVHLFEPFWSKRRGGTGLGLTIARDAVERHGGRIVVDDAPGGGTVFAVHLPMEGSTS